MIDLDAVPLSQAVHAAVAGEGSLRDVALTGGDDYEIVFTAPPDRLDAMTRAAQAADLAVTVVGEVAAGTGPPLFHDAHDPRQFARGSFRHF